MEARHRPHLAFRPKFGHACLTDNSSLSSIILGKTTEMVYRYLPIVADPISMVSVLVSVVFFSPDIYCSKIPHCAPITQITYLIVIATFLLLFLGPIGWEQTGKWKLEAFAGSGAEAWKQCDACHRVQSTWCCIPFTDAGRYPYCTLNIIVIHYFMFAGTGRTPKCTDPALMVLMLGRGGKSSCSLSARNGFTFWKVFSYWES